MPTITLCIIAETHSRQSGLPRKKRNIYELLELSISLMTFLTMFVYETIKHCLWILSHFYINISENEI